MLRLGARLLGVHSLLVLPVSPVSVSRGGGFFTLGLTGASETLQIIITFLSLTVKKSSSDLPRGEIINLAFML